MPPTRKSGSGFKIGLAILGVATLGVGVFWWLRKHKKPEEEGQGEAPLEGSLPLPLPQTVSLAAPAIVPPADTGTVVGDLPVQRGSKPIARSYTLPGPQVGAVPQPETNAVRLVSSTDQAYNVMVRVVDPPGAFGIFAYDANQINIYGAQAIPVGDTIIIPVGQWQRIPLAPYSSLYGRGSVLGVTASVTGHPAGPSVPSVLDAGSNEAAG
jgi:hypothetical protein